MEIMKATQGEAQMLSDLAFRAKAYWGYNQEFMETCREDLAVTAAEIETNHVYVAKDVGNAVGFYSLQCLQVEAELNKFFVDIGTIRKGIGKRLWEHMRKTARQMYVERVLIHSHPYAEGFYRAMGAKRIGEVPSSVFPNRKLPLMEYVLEDGKYKRN